MEQEAPDPCAEATTARATLQRTPQRNPSPALNAAQDRWPASFTAGDALDQRAAGRAWTATGQQALAHKRQRQPLKRLKPMTALARTPVVSRYYLSVVSLRQRLVRRIRMSPQRVCIGLRTCRRKSVLVARQRRCDAASLGGAVACPRALGAGKKNLIK